jgi:CheY-like chemotaxis protein
MTCRRKGKKRLSFVHRLADLATIQKGAKNKLGRKIADHFALTVRCGYDDRMAKILIADDSPDSRESLGKYLQLSGHEVTSVQNGREALTQVLKQVPDVILLDLIMPEMDGPSFLKVIRSYLRLQSLPVVVLTGYSDSPMVDRVKALNVNSVLAKGNASPTEIRQSLEDALRA